MSYIDSYTGRTFGWGDPDDASDITGYKSITETNGNADGEVYDGGYNDGIWLSNCDIVSVDEVTIGDPTIGTPQALTATDYLWRADGRLLLGGSSFSSSVNSSWWGDNRNSFTASRAAGYQTIKVKYHYGYYGVPGDVAMACMDLCGSVAGARAAARGVAQERIGDYSITYGGVGASSVALRTALSTQPDLLNVLNKYRMKRM